MNNQWEQTVQRALALVAGMSGLLSGSEVTLEHYRGSFGQRIMYSPVALSAALGAAGAGAALSSDTKSSWMRRWLPLASWALIADGLTGFYFHVRGIARKPGGWREPVTNIVMGPPIFAPLLLPIGGVLGLVACHWPMRGRGLQKTVYGVTATSALLNGAEALYSHYKSGFRRNSQWIPIVLAPAMAACAIGAMAERRSARRLLPWFSLVAMAAGGLGSYLHLKTVMRRPGFKQMKFYNLVYGPPTLAPLLFSATGFMGLLGTVCGPADTADTTKAHTIKARKGEMRDGYWGKTSPGMGGSDGGSGRLPPPRFEHAQTHRRA
jgi:hypothetical protein